MKICPKCNAQLGDNMTFCPTCGTVFSAPQQQPPVGGYNPYPNPQQQPPMGGYNPNANPYANPNPNPQPNPMAPALPMNWYKFLIYFMLFASAVINAIMGIMYITGSVYSVYGGSGANAEEIYRYFPNLKTVDIIPNQSRVDAGKFSKTGNVYLLMGHEEFLKRGWISNFIFEAFKTNIDS